VSFLLPWILCLLAFPQQQQRDNYLVRSGVTPPVPISRVEPKFTELARDAEFQGPVLVQIVVNAEGQATDAHVNKKVGMGLDEEAIASVLQWKFQPATKDGQPVAVYAQVEVTFRGLNPSDSSWMAAASRSNDSVAWTRVGKAHYWGKNVTQNYLAALSWFQKAAAQDEARAESYLGMMYSQGQGVHKDSAEAAGWFRKSAEQNDVVGQVYLGKVYMEGDGLPIDFVQAHLWLSLAKQGGQAAQAASLLEQLLPKMTPTEIESAKVLLQGFKPRVANR
jgi:TonB family protein